MKRFFVSFVDVEREKESACGLFTLGSFKQSFGTPVEKEIFEQAVTKGTVYICKIDSEYSIDDWYIYHHDIDLLKKEYKEKCSATEKDY